MANTCSIFGLSFKNFLNHSSGKSFSLVTFCPNHDLRFWKNDHIITIHSPLYLTYDWMLRVIYCGSIKIFFFYFLINEQTCWAHLVFTQWMKILLSNSIMRFSLHTKKSNPRRQSYILWLSFNLDHTQKRSLCWPLDSLIILFSITHSKSLAKEKWWWIRKKASQSLLDTQGSFKVMEQSSSSPKSSRRGGLLSCWGRLKLKLPWTKKTSTYKPIGGFGYDPLSYAQNFDEGWVEGDEQSSRRRFSARYAAPSSSTKSLK